MPLALSRWIVLVIAIASLLEIDSLISKLFVFTQKVGMLELLRALF